jgi:hypothetical protein
MGAPFSDVCGQQIIMIKRTPYVLIYEYPLSGPEDMLNLKVFGKYIPVEVHKKALRGINKSIPSNNGVK